MTKVCGLFLFMNQFGYFSHLWWQVLIKLQKKILSRDWYFKWNSSLYFWLCYALLDLTMLIFVKFPLNWLSLHVLRCLNMFNVNYVTYQESVTALGSLCVERSDLCWCATFVQFLNVVLAVMKSNREHVHFCGYVAGYVCSHSLLLTVTKAQRSLIFKIPWRFSVLCINDIWWLGNSFWCL